MIEYINYDDIIVDDKSHIQSRMENILTYNRILITNLIKLNNIYKFNKIITNTRIGNILQDSSLYSFGNVNHTLNTIKHVSNETYLLGTLSSFNVYVNPNLTWDDNNIYITIDKLELRRLKMEKIINNDYDKSFLEKIIIDNKILDILL